MISTLILANIDKKLKACVNAFGFDLFEPAHIYTYQPKVKFIQCLMDASGQSIIVSKHVLKNFALLKLLEVGLIT